MHIHGRLGNCHLRRGLKAEKARYKIDRLSHRWKEKPARERIISAFAKTPGDTLPGSTFNFHETLHFA